MGGCKKAEDAGKTALETKAETSEKSKYEIRLAALNENLEDWKKNLKAIEDILAIKNRQGGNLNDDNMRLIIAQMKVDFYTLKIIEHRGTNPEATDADKEASRAAAAELEKMKKTNN